MKIDQYLQNLRTPERKVDVILDTDTFNEIDDQYAIGYMLGAEEKLSVKGICAAPFFGEGTPWSESPKDGMLKSYDEILKVLKFAKRQDMLEKVYHGSETFLQDENIPVNSDAAIYISEMADHYSPENPLYIVCISALTNVASAILLNPAMKENAVVVWLGGHALHMNHSYECNMLQDVAAARVVFGSGIPLIQLPCLGVVDTFSTTEHELKFWLQGKNELCDYLIQNTVQMAERYAKGKPWSRVIWDVTAVAWLLNDEHQFMEDELIHSPIPQYDHHYGFDNSRHFICYVKRIYRDALMEDLFKRLTKETR